MHGHHGLLRNYDKSCLSNIVLDLASPYLQGIARPHYRTSSAGGVIAMATSLEQLLRYLPKQPDYEYETRGGKPGIVFKFQVEKCYVTVSVTGVDSQELPPEVATALAAWSLGVLASRVGESKTR